MAKSADHAGAERILQQALRHHRAHRLQEASALYRRVLTMRPGDAAALQNLALIAMERGRYPFAAELLSRAVIQQPGDADAHYNLGLALQNLGRAEEAIASYDRALASRADFVEARYNRGNALRTLGRLGDAAADYRSAIAIQPGFLAAHGNLATCLAASGRTEEAAEAYRAALALAPDEAALHNNLGTALADLGRLDDAAAAYRRALSLDPSLADAWFNLHGTQYDGDGERAAQCLEEVLRLSPGHELGRFLLGVLRERQGRMSAAQAHFSALPPDCAVAAYGPASWEYIKSAMGLDVPLLGETAEGLSRGLAAARVAGLVLEFGVRYGTTLRQIAECAGQEVHGFDTFTGLPEAWHERPAGTYSVEGELPPVAANVHLHAGLFEHTLPGFLAAHPEPIRFINIDCDLYSATKTVLTLLTPRVVPGTVIAFDEYLFTPHWREDEFKAFHEAVAANGWRYDYLSVSLLSKQAVVIIR